MGKTPVPGTDKREKASLVLLVETSTDRDGQTAKRLLEELIGEFPELGSFEVIEMNGRSIGEELPFLATQIGIARGVADIEYFVHSERRLRQAESAA